VGTGYALPFWVKYNNNITNQRKHNGNHDRQGACILTQNPADYMFKYCLRTIGRASKLVNKLVKENVLIYTVLKNSYYLYLFL
jgi:hypothetical protein